MKVVPLFGRILFSLMFIIFGMNHFTKFPMMTGYTQAMGVPFAGVMVILTGIMLVVGGLCVLLGYKAKFGGALIALFLLPTTFIMHRFWDTSVFTSGQAQMEQMIQFFKNLVMAGGALIISYFGSGPLSLEKQKSF